MSVVNCPNPLTRRREYLRSPIARKVGGPLKAMSFLMSTQAGFSPDDIASLAHWYDATELTGFSDGESVGTWPDEEGTDDLTQGTGSKQPTYQTGVIGGNPIVRFDGSDDFMDVAFTNLSTPYQIFIVAAKRSGVDDTVDYLYDGGTGNEAALFGDNNVNGNDWTLYSGSRLNSGTNEDAADHIFNALWNGASSTLRLDGTQIVNGDPGTNQLTGFAVGARGDDTLYGDYDVGEILIYGADLTDSDRDSAESYLANKWGITLA